VTRAAAIAIAMLAMMTPAAAETVSLYAAGSLKAALTDVGKAFEKASGNKVEGKFGPSGLLRKEIADGAPAHVFASANMEHPQSLHAAGKSGAVTMFARNRLCALVRPGLNVSSENLLTALLDPKI
jgi:molybdenum ABC transporter molybdate-binding protein